MPYQLVVLEGRSSNKVLKLANAVTTIGRQQDCELRISSAQVSRKHCQLIDKGTELLVIDLGSSNGTFVNGRKVTGQCLLKPGDTLGFGKVKFRVEKRAAGVKPSETAVPPTPAPVPELDDMAPVAQSDDDVEFEIDFDDEVEEEDVMEEATSTSPSPAAQTPLPEPAPAKPQAEKAKEKEQPKGKEMGDEAVADFLMSIDLDEDDKR